MANGIKLFFSNYADPNSLSDNVINDIIEDDQQNLWIAGLYQGLTKYNLRTGQMKRYARLSADDRPGHGIKQLLFHQGELWIGTAGRGLAHYLPKTDTFEFFMAQPSEHVGDASGTITGIAKDQFDPDRLWLSSETGLYRFDIKTKVFTQYSIPYPDIKVAPLPFLCIETDNENQIWLGTWYRGLYSFEPRTERFERHFFTEADPADAGHYLVLDIKCINDSTIYVATGNSGLVTFNIHDPEIKPLLMQDQLPDGSSGIDIQRISVTPDAGVFVGGNYFIYQEHPSFNRFSRSFIMPYGPRFQMEDIFYDSIRNGYWMACFDLGKIILFEKNMNTYQEFSTNNDQPIQSLDVAMDAHHRIWVTTVSSGLLILNDAEQRFENASLTYPELKSLAEQPDAVESDAMGNLWLANQKQITYLDIETGQLRKIDLGLANPALTYDIKFKSGLHDDAWLASGDGLFHCLREQSKIIHLLPDPANANAIAATSIKAMTVDKAGNAWLGFENDGVQVVSWQDHKLLNTFNLDNGLPYMQINYMATDTAGCIWAGTATGLICYNPAASSPIWQLFNRQDGVQRDYIDSPFAPTSDGKFFFNIEEGISWIDIGANRELATHTPTLSILSFLVDGHPYRHDVLPNYFTAVDLDYNVKEIRIEFAAMDWLHPFRTKYFYRIEGITAPGVWKENKEAVITLSGMKPGSYELQLYAVSGDGIKSKEVKLPVIIHPPFWQRWWFLMLCAFALSAIFYSIYQYRIRQFQKMQAMRNTISTNLHDDIGASLSNIHILTSLTQRNLANTPQATSYITKAGEEIQRISESLSDIVWNISPRYDDLTNLFIRMKRYAADMLDGKQIQSDLIFPETVERITMPMDQRRDFYLLFKEGINNLVKYSGATMATIQVYIDNHVIVLEMIDNGVGFDVQSDLPGNGVLNMKQRAAKWKANLDIQSSPGAGTRIRLEMRVSR
jgi:ligand-binding sensor domain-containing protein/two-component sensor histidine kinase